MQLTTILCDAAVGGGQNFTDILVMIGQFILSISLLVGLHELGHMLAAKAFGMRVEQFSIGFPPRIFGKKIGETEYTIGAIPLGGFVKISGMVDESLDKSQLAQPPKPWEFRSKPAWQRLIVMLGGIIVNVLTGILVYTGIFYHYGKEYLPAREARYGIVAYDLAKQIGLQTGDKILEINGKSFNDFDEILSPELLVGSNGYYTVERGGDLINVPVPNNLADILTNSDDKLFVLPIQPFSVGNVQPGSAADKAGLQKNDKITAVAGTPINFFHELQQKLSTVAGKPADLEVLRNNQKVTLHANVGADGKLGFEPAMELNTSVNYYSLPQSLSLGANRAFEVVWLNIKGLEKLIIKREGSLSNSISGPVGIARLFGGNVRKFWELTGMLSMVLAFMNLLPIPALDGGHVMFLFWEIISRRKPSEKFLEGAQKVGMALLLSLMVYAVFNDVFKLFVK